MSEQKWSPEFRCIGDGHVYVTAYNGELINPPVGHPCECGRAVYPNPKDAVATLRAQLAAANESLAGYKVPNMAARALAAEAQLHDAAVERDDALRRLTLTINRKNARIATLEGVLREARAAVNSPVGRFWMAWATDVDALLSPTPADEVKS